MAQYDLRDNLGKWEHGFTEDQFIKMSFKAGMLIEAYKRGEVVMCTLLAVDFEEGILRLWPIPEDGDGNEEIQMCFTHCRRGYKLTKA